MNVTICAVGRLRSGPEQSLFESYVERLPWTVRVHEIEIKGQADPQKKSIQETQAITGKIPPGAIVICLDSRGKSESSEKLAKRIAFWRDEGVRDIAIVIGGADGIDGSLIDNSDLVLSFGAVTWPHLLMRVLVAEQLYRSHCILTDHPYHRGH